MSGLRGRFVRDVAERIVAPPVIGEPVAEADLATLPALVQRYLRVCGVVGQPRVHTLHARMHGRIRSGPRARWMPMVAEQHTAMTPPTRLFHFDATMAGLPIQGYHRYADGAASMIVRAAGVVPLVRVDGLELTRSETVTFFNDMCVLAPATLLSPSIVWQADDAPMVRARFSAAGHTIEAALAFGDDGRLVDFRSRDRARTAGDGTVERLDWSTPLREPWPFGAVRLAAGGEARWHGADGDYAYVELTFDEVRYNGCCLQAASR